MNYNNRSAFTMLELIFAIVIIGILSAVAIPKFAATRDDATVSKAKSTLASVRSAIATERQKRILKGDFTPITDLAKTHGANQMIFDAFDANTSNAVLEYSPRACKNASQRGCWISHSATSYVYRMPISGDVTFTLGNQRLTCDPDDAATGKYCKRLTE